MQRRFFELKLRHPQHYNQSVMLVPLVSVQLGALQNCLVKLAEHHDMLRASFNPDQQVLPCSSAAAAVHVQEETLELQDLESCCKRLQQLRLAGPLVQATLLQLRGDAEGTRLLLVIHHLVVDLISWQVILEDLEKLLLHELGLAGEPQLSAVPSSFKEYARQKKASEVHEPNLDWAKMLAKEPLGDNSWGAAKRQVRHLPPIVAETLTAAPHARPVELLLAALVQAYASCGSLGSLWVDLEGHGRDGNFAQTVGWFTELQAVQLRAGKSLDQVIRETKDRCCFAEEAEVQPMICVNYHGKAGQLEGDLRHFALAPEWELLAKHDIHPENQREYLLEVEAMLVTGSCGRLQLRVEWIYHPQLDESMCAWLEEFLRQTDLVAEHCMRTARRASLADFPLLRGAVTLSAFDDWLAKLAEPDDVEDIYPCTPLQEGMMAETLLDPRANVEQLALLLTGAKDAWRDAWTRVVARHQALRARLVPPPLLAGRRFWQVIFKAGTAPATPEWQEGVWDFEAESSALPLSQSEEAKLMSLVCSFMAQDVSRGCHAPRFALFEVRRGGCSIEGGLHVLIRTEHHSISDGWSNPLMLQEALRFYEGGDFSDAAPCFACYVSHVLASTEGESRETLRGFWKQQLAGWTGAMPLAALKAPASLAPEGPVKEARMEFQQLRSSLKWPQVGEHQVTKAAMLHAAWALLLASRGSRDVVFGAVLSGRDVPVPGVEGMVGLLICTLPLRIQISGSCRDLALQVQKSLAELSAHQFCNLAEIREWCGLRGPAKELFQTMLVFENYPDDAQTSLAQALHGEVPVTGASLPLAVVVVPQGCQLQVTFRFDSSLYSCAEVQSMLRDFGIILESMLEWPSCSCEELLPVLPMLHAGLPWARRWAPLLNTQVTVSQLPVRMESLGTAPAKVAMPGPPREAGAVWRAVGCLGRALCRLAECQHVTVVVCSSLVMGQDVATAPLPVHVSRNSSDTELVAEDALRNLPRSLDASLAAMWELLADAGPVLWAAVGEEELLAKLPVRPVAAHAWGKEEAWLCCATCLGHLLRSCLGESDAFPPPDVQQLLVEDFNDTSHSWASGRCLPQLLSERLQKLPAGHPALVSYDEHGEECSRMTYQELSAHVDCAVSALYALRPGAVALWMPRCSQAVRCALAILRAGAVYVPCDGRLPWERVAFMAQAASAQLLVAGAEQLESMPLQSTLQVIAADELEQTQAGSETWSSELAVSEGDLAYVIFTSGSTGKPKGVAVTHRSIVHLIEWVNSTYNIDHNDSLLFTTSISFDLSCYDMFGSLAAGSTVHVAPELSPKKLFQVLQKGHITFWDSAPQVLQQLEPFIGALDSLRLVFLSGDWVPLQLTQMLRRAMGGGRVVALGGATEVTVWSNFFEVGDLDPEWRSIPYGRPIWNHQYYCLDAQSAPLHVGMTGELYIGGVGVARGYVGRADLSAERFLENPFHPGRVYRTGDMVRFMPLRPWGVYHNSCEVVLEFLGRKDSQVKVRGFRVELAEVELSFAAQGLDCAVLALPSACPAVLVAFVRAEEQRATETRDRLTQQLPHYMVPEVCSVEALPLTRSGKVDRQALEAWWAQRRTAFRAPITKQQQRVVEAFREALGQEVGLDDDFFELGGHSLSAMRLQMALGDLSLQEVFHARTPAALAELLELRSGGVKAAPPLQKMERGDLVPASYAQERLWLAHCLQPGPRYNVAFAFRGRASLVALLGALQRLLERHEALRTVLQGGGEESGHGQLFQRILEAEEVKIPVSAPACAMRVCSCVWLQALGVEDAAVAAMRADAAEGFDLTSGLLRVRLFHSSSDFLLYFNVHHAAFDAASQALLKKELAMDLNGDHLQTPSVQYADYALWQQQWLAEGEKQRCLDYWKEELRGASFKLHLPTDVPRPRDLTHGFVTSRWPLSALAGVRSAAKQLPASEMAAMLSLFGLLLGRRFGQEDLLVGIPESGRGSDPALQNVVGFFVNTLPIRIRLLEAKETFMDLLGRTQKTLLDAMDHATIPFQHLVEEARRAKELDPGHSPLVQAFFQHIATGQFSHQSPMLEDFNFEALPTPAKFEVSLQTSVESSLSLRWEFMPEVLPLETIRLLDRHLLVMAKRLAADCNSALCHLRERPSDEHAAVLHDWSTSHALPLPDCRLEDLFIQQAMRTPKQTALVLRKNRLSFADLLAAAQALGARLGLAKSRVGVLAERSLELPVALLAVLMAGAAFVPLTPDLPRERLRFSLSEAKAGALLATPQVAATASALAEELAIPWSIVSLDNLKNLESVETPARPAERIAYVLFTSGSTGRPKGVAVSHRALLSHLLPYVRILKLTPADRILQTSPFTFDMAYSQIFGALLSGAQLVLTRENPMVDPMELAQVLEQESVTFTTLVPSVLSAMVHAKPEICLPALRHLGCGGEPLRSKFRQVRLHNRYGPTECAINSTLFGPFGPDEINGERDVPIGWPSAHRHVAVEAGELLLAGPGLAGYVAREASAFRSSLRGAGQQYHTGDQVSRGTRGCLGFLGRRDFQVKLQGQRIELAEIEQVISTLPQVRSCAVVVNHVPMLVAFISGEAPQEVLAQCCKHLPPAMVPRVQVLDDQSWPRTSSNKLDRRALADMASKLVQDPQRVLGTSAVEEAVNTLLEVLADLGHVVSAACSLGLTSLLALRVVAQARRRGLELSVRRLLAPGATALAVATEATAGRPEDEAVDLLLGAVRLQVRHMTEPSGDWEVLVCPGDGGAGVEGYRPLAVALQSACRVWVVDGLLSTCRSLEEMAEEVLRCWRCSGKRRVLLGHSWGVLLALQLAQLTDVEAVWLLDPSKHHFAPAEPVMDHEAELLELLARLCQAGAAQGLLMAARSGRMTEMEKVLSQNQFQRLRQAAAARSHNLSLRASYKPLHVPVHVILASEMEATPQQRLLDLDCIRSISRDVAVSWTAGTHYSMLEPSNCTALAAALLGTLSSPA